MSYPARTGYTLRHAAVHVRSTCTGPRLRASENLIDPSGPVTDSTHGHDP
ncbi:hypothetical protein LY15_003553 [Prauserella flava]|uniref:Uncharacterized protein n=1 Tax=Prauserella sediminis TaxID=577680 RepID=A0A839XWE4_9PSEU|nr:hypothetical protein [Prauserella sediminis]MCR3721559.1 hypothetical protein [Prauserella flava]MCR3734251.1 hypothetical protein [Prauserella salsuginis]